MSLYVIGDLHLSLAANKPMDVFGGEWEGYVSKIEAGFSEISDADTVVIAGDLSWGIDLVEAQKDFLFLSKLPGEKIVLKGNHDYYWTTVTKMNAFLCELEISNIRFLHNNAYLAEGVAIAGTRGWPFEEEGAKTPDEKVYRRELLRLEASLAAMERAASLRVCVLHYPPIYGSMRSPEIVALLEKYEIDRCYYGHLHSHSRRLAFEGEESGISYRLVSADHVNFKPVKII